MGKASKAYATQEVESRDIVTRIYAMLSLSTLQVMVLPQEIHCMGEGNALDFFSHLS